MITCDENLSISLWQDYETFELAPRYLDHKTQFLVINKELGGWIKQQINEANEM